MRFYLIHTGLQPGDSTLTESTETVLTVSGSSFAEEKPVKRLETVRARFTGLKPRVNEGGS